MQVVESAKDGEPMKPEAIGGDGCGGRKPPRKDSSVCGLQRVERAPGR